MQQWYDRCFASLENRFSIVVIIYFAMRDMTHCPVALFHGIITDKVLPHNTEEELYTQHCVYHCGRMLQWHWARVNQAGKGIELNIFLSGANHS